MSKYTYYNGDSGRVLVNGLHLVPGVVYESTDNEVRYAEGVTKVNKDVIKVLVEEKLLVPVKAEASPKPAPKPSPIPAEATPKPAEKTA